jgi:hypothetical protein
MKKFVLVVFTIMMANTCFGQNDNFQSISFGPIFSIAPKSIQRIPAPVESLGLMIGINNVIFNRASVWISACPNLNSPNLNQTGDYRIGFEYHLSNPGKKRVSPFSFRLGGILGYSRYPGLYMLTGEEELRFIKDQSLKIGPSFYLSYDLDNSVLERYKVFIRLNANVDLKRPVINESDWCGATVGIEFTPKSFSW